MATLPENRKLSEADLVRQQEAKTAGELRQVVAKGIEAQELLDQASNRVKNLPADVTSPVVDGVLDIEITPKGQDTKVEATARQEPSEITKENLGALMADTLNSDADIEQIAKQITNKALGPEKPE